jgi:4a-hydroxytetrahydrobiopterin dehydratase
MSDLLPEETVDEQLPKRWQRQGDEITRTYEFDAYLDGVEFVDAIARIADEEFHHPEIIIGWREVEVRLTTHDAGGITEADLDLAEQFEDEY